MAFGMHYVKKVKLHYEQMSSEFLSNVEHLFILDCYSDFLDFFCYNYLIIFKWYVYILN